MGGPWNHQFLELWDLIIGISELYVIDLLLEHFLEVVVIGLIFEAKCKHLR